MIESKGVLESKPGSRIVLVLWDILGNGINNWSHCKKSTLVCGNHIKNSMWVYNIAWKLWKMAYVLCWKFIVVNNVHIQYAMTIIFGTCVLLLLYNSFRSAYLLVVHWYILENGINILLLQKNPLWVCGNHSTELSMSMLNAWIFWEMASALSWTIHCGVQCAHLLFNGNNTCCMCLVVITLQSLFVYSACSSAKFFAKHGQIKMNIVVFHYHCTASIFTCT